MARKLIKKHPELHGTLFEEIGTIVQTACYAHDMGNPPFGHSGEKAIQTFFTEGAGTYLKEKVSSRFWNDITHFEGNANAFRLLTHRFLGRREGGFVMTYATLARCCKVSVLFFLGWKTWEIWLFYIRRKHFQEDSKRTWYY